jgi:hypothetical protein
LFSNFLLVLKVFYLLLLSIVIIYLMHVITAIQFLLLDIKFRFNAPYRFLSPYIRFLSLDTRLISLSVIIFNQVFKDLVIRINSFIFFKASNFYIFYGINFPYRKFCFVRLINFGLSLNLLSGSVTLSIVRLIYQFPVLSKTLIIFYYDIISV